MNDDPEPQRLTVDDVSGLRADTRQLAESIDRLADRQTATAAVVETKADTSTVEEVQRAARRAFIASLVAAAAILAVFVAAAVGYRQNDDRISDITSGRTETRAAICSGFEAFTNALVASGGAPTDRAAFEAKVAAFTADLEQRLGPLGCHLTIVIPGG